MTRISLSVTQNFIKEATVEKVFSPLVKIPDTITVVDIGAGTGNITEWLYKHTKNQILAFELDQQLVTVLRSKFGQTNRVAIQAKNFLQAEPMSGPYCVVANIPFMITTAIIKQLTDDLLFQEGYLILQKEAAYRFGGNQVSQPSGLLSTLLEVDFKLEILHSFTARDFSPAPQVSTVLLHLKRKPEGEKFKYRTEFSDFVSYLFNKSVPILRKAPLVGRFLARKIVFDQIPLLQKKPSDLSLQDYEYLFTLCDQELLDKINGYGDEMKEQGNSVEKVYRTRNSTSWRDMV